MARIFDRVSETTMRWYDGLSDRERRLVTIFLGCVVVLVLFGALFLSTSKITTKRADLVRNKQLFTEVRDLEGEYLKAKEKNERALMSVKRNNVSLFTFIQGITSRLGLSVKDLNEQTRPLAKTGMIEVSVRVNLTKLSIDKVTALLEAIATSEEGELVKVTRLKVNKRFDEPDLLDLQMTVSTWKSA